MPTFDVVCTGQERSTVPAHGEDCPGDTIFTLFSCLLCRRHSV